MTGRWLVLVGIASAILVSAGDADAKKKKRTLCPGGRFIVHERPLIVADPTLVVDGVIIMPQARMLSVRSGCPLTRVKLKATKKGTRVRGKWSNCTGLVGRVRLKALIDRSCERMTGKIRAKRAKYKRKFVATLSRCGDGIYDREGGEQCDGIQGCGAGFQCSAQCTCVIGGPDGTGSTTTTLVGGGSSTTTTTTVPNTDLTVSAPASAGLMGEAGQSIPFSWLVKNIGTVVARPPYRDAVYLSRDDTGGRNDEKIAEFKQTLPLLGGESYQIDADLLLPFVPTDDYYLVFRTDDANQVLESNELNNEQAVLIRVKAPNLVATQLQDQPDPNNGRRIFVTWNVLNDGEAPLRPPWQDILYLSTDRLLDDFDRQLWPPRDGSEQTQLVPPHQRYNRTVAVSIPSAVRAGDYYLILAADADDAIFEDREDDNFVDEPIRID